MEPANLIPVKPVLAVQMTAVPVAVKTVVANLRPSMAHLGTPVAVTALLSLVSALKHYIRRVVSLIGVPMLGVSQQQKIYAFYRVVRVMEMTRSKPIRKLPLEET